MSDGTKRPTTKEIGERLRQLEHEQILLGTAFAGFAFKLRRLETDMAKATQSDGTVH